MMLDRVFQWSILGMLGCSYLSIVNAGALDAISLGLAGVAIVVRVLMVSGLIRIDIPNWLANTLTVAYLGFFPVDLRYLSGEFLPATIHLVFFLASLIILRARSPRDFFFIKVSALSLILAASVLSAGLGFLVWLVLFVICGVTAQISGEIRGNLVRPKGLVAKGWTAGATRRVTALAACIVAGVLVLGGGLFFVLPRTAQAALRHFTPERFRLPGFSNEVLLGQIGQIRMTSTPVMHARLFGEAARPLKWRGSALSRFDGRRWYNDPGGERRLLVNNGQVRVERPVRTGMRIAGEVQLKSATGDALFFPGVPEVLVVDSPHVLATPVDGFRLPLGRARGQRYQFYAVLEDPEPALFPGVIALTDTARLRYLATPDLDPRIAELARSVTVSSRGQLLQARAMEQYLRTRYSYTIELLDTPVPDPIAHFLFERRKGHCEYFASAMALMLRTIGIPSRIATGFQSGTFNPISGWHLIRASDAHSWVEAFVEGYGWVTMDPTPPDPTPRGVTLLSQLGMYLDAAEVFWQDWVVSYDLERQLLLADRMGRTSRSLSLDWPARWSGLRGGITKLTAYWVPAALLLAAAIAAWWFGPAIRRWWRIHSRVRTIRTGRGESSDATLLYERFLAILKRRGKEKPAWMTPNEFAAEVRAPLITEITQAYQRLRYGGDASAARTMAALLAQLEQQR